MFRKTPFRPVGVYTKFSFFNILNYIIFTFDIFNYYIEEFGKMSIVKYLHAACSLFF